jgi:hypothetical protein
VQGLLRGYRAALYFGIGLGGLGVLIALAFGTNHFLRARREKEVQVDGALPFEQRDIETPGRSSGVGNGGGTL